MFLTIILIQVGARLEAMPPESRAFLSVCRVAEVTPSCPGRTRGVTPVTYAVMSTGIFIIRKVFKSIFKVKEGAPDKTKQRHLACVLLVKIPSQQQYNVS